MKIENLDDLKLITKKKPNEITFKMPELDDAKNIEWSHRFNELLNDCGCSSGRQYIMYASPVYFLGLIVLVSYSSLSKAYIVGIVATAFIITGIVGKVLGLMEKRNKIKALIERFNAECSSNS